MRRLLPIVLVLLFAGEAVSAQAIFRSPDGAEAARREVTVPAHGAASVKAIGISRTTSPAFHALWFISSWKEYPADATVAKSIFPSAVRLQHLKPPVGSLNGIPVTVRMKIPPAREISRRLNGQPGVEPPRT